MDLIRRMAEKRGVIILTDSDGAGFVIRNHLKSCLPKEQVKHAYIPDVYGKESRKRTRSKEGKLGVEGISSDILKKALISAGATVDGNLTEVLEVDGRQLVKVVAWYDNEMGYSAQMVRTASKLVK